MSKMRECGCLIMHMECGSPFWAYVGCPNYIDNYRVSCVGDNSSGWRSVSDDFPTRSRYKFERPAIQQQSMYDVCVC
jgi:hypothetical protein